MKSDALLTEYTSATRMDALYPVVKLDSSEPYTMKDIIKYIGKTNAPVANLLERLDNGEKLNNLKDEELTELRKYLLGNCMLTRVIWGGKDYKKNGKSIEARSWDAIDYIYNNKIPDDRTIDKDLEHIFMNTAACKGVRNRKNYAESKLGESIVELCKENGGNVHIANLGSGVAKGLIKIFKNLSDMGIKLGKDGVHATCLDLSQDVIKEGIKTTSNGNRYLNGSIKYKRGIVELLDRYRKNGKFKMSQLGLMTGLPDYYNEEGAAKLLSSAGKIIVPEGKLITANIKPHDVGNNSLMGILEWKLYERDDKEFENVIKNSGFENGIYTEPQGIFMISAAKKANVQ